MLEEKLMVLARPFLKDPLAVQAKLCRRMERFIKELFVFVSDPAVPSDNNAAERSLLLAGQRSQSPPGMPPVAHFPSTLNSFGLSTERPRPKTICTCPEGGPGPFSMKPLQTFTAIVPPTPGVLSALGLLVASIRHEQVVSVHQRPTGMNYLTLQDLLDELDQKNTLLMGEERVPPHQVSVSWEADMRYVGQSYEIRIPIAASITPQTGVDLIAAFHDAHAEIYSINRGDQDVEIINLRSIHTHPLDNTPRFHMENGAADGPGSRRTAVFPGSESVVSTPVFERHKLHPGQLVSGPAIVEQPDTTTVVYPGQSFRIDDFGNLLITLDEESA